MECVYSECIHAIMRCVCVGMYKSRKTFYLNNKCVPEYIAIISVSWKEERNIYISFDENGISFPIL